MALSADEKCRMIEHVEYEVIMFMGAAAELDMRDCASEWVTQTPSTRHTAHVDKGKPEDRSGQLH